jgi:hypothetical protein
VAKPKLCYDEIVRQKDGSWLPRAVVMAMDERRQRSSALDRLRAVYDECSPEEKAEFMEGELGENPEWGEDCARRASDKRRARDEPPEFSGRPETGGGMTDPAYTSVTSNDRRRGRAHDSRTDRARDRFAEMFPNEHLFDEFGRRMIP